MPTIWWWKRRRQWVADVKDPETGKRKRWYLGGDERDARRRFHLRMAELCGVQARDSRPELMSFQELAQRWLAWSGVNCAPETTSTRRSYVRWIPVRHWAESALSLKPEVVERIKGRMQSRRATATVNHFVRTIKGMFSWAVKQGLFEVSPVRHVRQLPAEAPRGRALSLERAERIAAVCDARAPLGDFCRFLLYTGMRRREAADLRWADYDAGQELVTLRRHKTVRHTGRAKLVPLSKRAVEILGCQPRRGVWVWTTPNGAHITAGAFSQRLQRLRKHHPGLLTGQAFHVFRHTFVSELRRQGVARVLVAELVGDTSRVLDVYYTHIPVESLRAAAAKMGQ